MKFFQKYKRLISFVALFIMLSVFSFKNYNVAYASEIETFVGEVVEAGTELAKVEKQLPSKGKVGLIKGALLTLGLSIMLTQSASHIVTESDLPAYQQYTTEMSEQISESFENWLEDTENTGLARWYENDEVVQYYSNANQNFLDTVKSANNIQNLWAIPDLPESDNIYYPDITQKDPISSVEDFIYGEAGSIGYNTGFLDVFNNFLRNMAKDVQDWIIAENAPDYNLGFFYTEDATVKNNNFKITYSANNNIYSQTFDFSGYSDYKNAITIIKCKYLYPTNGNYYYNYYIMPSYYAKNVGFAVGSTHNLASNGLIYPYLLHFENLPSGYDFYDSPTSKYKFLDLFANSNAQVQFIEAHRIYDSYSSRLQVDKIFGDVKPTFSIPDYLKNWESPDKIPLQFNHLQDNPKDFVNAKSLTNIGDSSIGNRVVPIKGYDIEDLKNALDYKNDLKSYDDFIDDAQKNNDMTMFDKDDIISNPITDNVQVPNDTIPTGGYIPDLGTDETPTVGEITGAGNNDIYKLPVNLKSVFPFCIPWDLKNAFLLLKAPPEIPVFTFHFKVEQLNADEEIVVDFSQFESVIQVFRTFATLFFIVSLIVLTRRIIRG